MRLIDADELEQDMYEMSVYAGNNYYKEAVASAVFDIIHNAQTYTIEPRDKEKLSKEIDHAKILNHEYKEQVKAVIRDYITFLDPTTEEKEYETAEWILNLIEGIPD